MFMVTTNDIPGYRITQVLGEVMGLTVRSTDFGQGFAAGFRSLGGGEIPEYTQVMYEARQVVMGRMWNEAQQRGGNAIVAMRFDAGSIQNFTEICAYGTAVVVEPLTPQASAPTQPPAATYAQPPTPPQF
ncbi:YbjQ family protein [Microbacterium sp. NPDC087665]|uniref:YbjQ family protein n=1 Tax=Microbacterium sp. NPDC087665 TaxID=3364194 RepID=UPI00382E549F